MPARDQCRCQGLGREEVPAGAAGSDDNGERKARGSAPGPRWGVTPQTRASLLVGEGGGNEAFTTRESPSPTSKFMGV
jgi:hypothetical protein